MEERNIFIFPFPLLWCLSNLFFDRLENQKVTLIICPWKSELLSEVVGGGFPALFQPLRSAGPSMVVTLLLTRTVWFRLFAIELF